MIASRRSQPLGRSSEIIGAGNDTSPVLHDDVPLCADKGNLAAFIATERTVLYRASLRGKGQLTLCLLRGD